MENDELLEELVGDVGEIVESVNDLLDHVNTAVTVELVEDLQANVTTALAVAETVAKSLKSVLSRITNVGE